ncbi:twin-arginine translocase TatA/TatE family subunit [Paenactinomyces guangxiensis]|uniref:Sec-independent protein translocase protein TatA n=1 Tax=Paenactinomyces guangxiensis TaxID=1490290 RepID=A0A7W2AA29_9BACL|nr:twin-arginine translocase TatA/TatE family subunit [Paenactinomyces guangxiensis]MBH8592786.1 twin-arginine translocase TatA/TatE family subunit [Paenactinomyces guangxiensis]
MSINGVEWLLIIGVALILFGPKKLPELGRALGKSIREFKKATNGLLEDDSGKKQEPSQTPGHIQKAVQPDTPPVSKESSQANQ